MVKGPQQAHGIPACCSGSRKAPPAKFAPSSTTNWLQEQRLDQNRLHPARVAAMPRPTQLQQPSTPEAVVPPADYQWQPHPGSESNRCLPSHPQRLHEEEPSPIPALNDSPQSGRRTRRDCRRPSASFSLRRPFRSSPLPAPAAVPGQPAAAFAWDVAAHLPGGGPPLLNRWPSL